MAESLASNGGSRGPGSQVVGEETQLAAAPTGKERRYGDYVIGDRLGAGAMGMVYKARQLVRDELTRTVALKVLKPELSNDPSFEERFFREAVHVVNLNHRNIVQGFSAAKENGVCFMAMEYIDGETLTDLVERVGPLSVGDALRITADVATGLEYAHERDVFHRDIKPGNVMVSRAGEVKVTDLGLAKAPSTDAELTHHGQIVGTPVFMAPEQSELADDPDARYDVYALGGTLFYLLAGQSPFSGFSVDEIARQKRRAPSVRAVRNDVPVEVDALVRRMLASNPAERPQSMQDVIDAIRKTGLANERLSWLPGGEPKRREHSAGLPAYLPSPRNIALGAAALFAVVAIWMIVAYSASLWPFSQPVPTPTQPPAPTVVPTPPSAPSTRPEVYVGRVMSLAAQGNLGGAGAAAREGQRDYPDDARLGRLAAEADSGVVPILEYEGDDGTVSPPVHLSDADGITLASGSQMRLGIALARECYVYVFDRDSVPKVQLLFPSSRLSSLINPLQPGLHWIPERDEQADADRWMRVDRAKGEDTVYVVAVTRPLRDQSKVMTDLRDDPDELRKTLKDDPGTLLVPGGDAKSCFATAEWSFFSFQHK
jgi:serine/threonine protein kinase